MSTTDLNHPWLDILADAFDKAATTQHTKLHAAMSIVSDLEAAGLVIRSKSDAMQTLEPARAIRIEALLGAAIEKLDTAIGATEKLNGRLPSDFGCKAP